ncbi:phosphatidylethanolamine-binding protein, partial [Tricharina praecox]|uniref:phosphatidylethanolamine-binding protein n=1 Tax=Tricharina praecox TaxID=43433 RepID=UPI0022207C3A
NANYIILCIDPDAPAPASQVLHFLGTDFSPAPGIGTNLSSDVDAALEYAPPAPPQGTGRHRYVWLLYRQPRGFVISDVPENRTGFDVQAWRGKNSLAEAVAGTFFVA